MDFFDKVKDRTNKVFKSIELSIEELIQLEPKKMEDAMDDFDKEILRLKTRLIELDKEKADIQETLNKHKETRKELIRKLRKKKF